MMLNEEAPWSADLQTLSNRLGLTRAPALIIKRSRFMPLYAPASWSHLPGAWAGLDRIIVSTALLGATEERRRYLLAHELGHIYCKHSWRGIILTIGTVLPIILLQTIPGLLRPFKLASALAFLVCGVFLLQRARSFTEEFEADAIAARLIGGDAVKQGILDMASLEGMTPKRRARLAALEPGANPTRRRVR